MILYELMAERHPFFSHDRRETEQKIRDGVEKVDFTMFDRECDTQVVDLIKKLLVKNPIHRLGSVSPQNADFRKSLNMEERDQRNGALAVKSREVKRAVFDIQKNWQNLSKKYGDSF